MEPHIKGEWVWGVAESAHQVEGGTRNDWTLWERETAARSAARARGRIWPEYIRAGFPSPLDEANYISGDAADQRHRFREDIELASRLGINAFRMSIEWSRVEPEAGVFDETAIRHYREVFAVLRARRIKPFVTLWHWTHPAWFADAGGWKSPSAIDDFCRYAKRMAHEFKDDVSDWILLNEPGLWAADAHLFGRIPPGEKSIRSLVRAYFTLMNAHRRAYAIVKERNPQNRVGIAESMEYMAHGIVRPLFDYLRNFYFIRSVLDSLDFIGINYYKRVSLWRKNSDRCSDTGWEIYPEGLGYFLRKSAQFGKPLYVTENGIADARDAKRPEFIRRHAEEAISARASGVPVKGYFYWSLIDNFEWADGFWPRFGLYEIDYRTQERRERPSALVYKEIIARNQNE
ncbi:MAG: hypothetical protein A2847_01790 [Candidatus Sungbacteria bacterium RIFCSPHIGHO2_01_FULL_50_25]|uniref:Beta-glucosidase n=1 Tax=Candidatus Sungbacteria bacterium RIFCSPHIGHO2_01_FULL_50_25 TaxID=1802265 RepID=A0A1G2KDI8_9BACT|nr:MAG: hypothetical protein A2847_01790 [Candidatus Sungbacteria bacterium RIFCSPHIGHO2_01_FULL_50_25]